MDINIQQKITLGVVSISWNEEDDIREFIEHLVDWVDEVVIIDDGSNDKTAEIALSYNDKVKFIVSPRQKDEYYSHQRNKGIHESTSDWLLHMDIDERVTPKLAEEIQYAINDEAMDAYRYRRLNYFLHRPMKGGGWQDWNLVHLAKREVFHFEGMFHETCHVNTDVERIGQLENKMIHLNDATYQERLRKSMTYSNEQLKRLITTYNRIQWYHFLFLPIVEFIRKWIIKKGFIDGTPGLIFAIHAADAMFRACALAWDQQNRIPRSDIENEIKKQWDIRNSK